MLSRLLGGNITLMIACASASLAASGGGDAGAAAFDAEPMKTAAPATEARNLLM
jgi:hypothetical protein